MDPLILNEMLTSVCDMKSDLASFVSRRSSFGNYLIQTFILGDTVPILMGGRSVVGYHLTLPRSELGFESRRPHA